MADAKTLEDRKWWALVLLAAAQFVVVLDASIVNVALPSIGEDLQFAQADLSWIINAYTLFFGGFLLLGGRLADLFGRRRVFMIGLVVFAAASLAGGLAQTDIQLVVARAAQGIGAALLSPAALSIVTTTFKEGAERNKALGVWGAVAGAGGAAGVLLGGVLTDLLSWEWVLFVNVPIGVAAALIAPSLLAESRDERANRTFDLAGAVTVTAGLAIFVYALVDAEQAAGARRRRSCSSPCRPCCSPRSSWSSAASARRSCRSRSSATRRCGRRTSSACSSACRSSRCSSSSRCTCSRCSASAR
jgi:MFS family permease